MTRDLFPRHDDRVVIDAFLRGRRDRHAHKRALETGLADQPPNLTYNGYTLAWTTPEGSLWAKLGYGTGTPLTMLAINHICERLGLPGRVSRELNVTPLAGDALGFMHSLTFFWNSAQIAIDQPFLLAGPLTLRAYRVSDRLDLQVGPSSRGSMEP